MEVTFKNKAFMIKDVLCNWAKVNKPVDKYKAKNGEQEYSIELLISEEIVDTFEDNHINKKPASLADKNKKALRKGKEAPYPEDQEDLYALKLTSTSIWPDGKEKKIQVVKEGKVFTDNIGNGSTVDVIGAISKKPNDDGLYTVYLSKLNVKDLIPFEDSSDEFSFEVGNFDTFEDDDVDFD